MHVSAIDARHRAPGRYTGVARLLHWLTVALVLPAIILGIWIGFFEPKNEALKFRLYNIHESTGITILLVTLLRLGWRAGHPPPPLPADLPAPLRFAARANHAGLYLLLLTMPVVGFLATNAWGFPVTWWGLIPLPDPIGRHETLAPVFSAIHFWLALTLLAMVALHVAAALWHQFIRRDGTLERML